MGRQRAARRGVDGKPGHAHRHVDERRREPGRQDARVRPPRRPLHAADRGRRGEAAHARDGVGDAAALLPRRQAHRVRQRRRRRRQRLADERRRHGRPRGVDRGLPPAQQPRLAPVGGLRRGAQALQRHAQPRLGRDLALPRERRQGRRPQREAELAEGPRRARVLPGRPLRLLLAGRDPGAHVRVQQELAPADLRDRAPRHDGRHDRAVRDRAGWRGAAGALARRKAPRVRPPADGADDAVREGPEDGRGASAVGRPRARPPGSVGDPRRLPRLRVAARGLGDRRLGAGEDLARRRGVGCGEGHPFPREGHARGPQGRALRDGRRPRRVRRSPAPLGDRVPRRRPGGLLGARVPLRQGPVGRCAAAPHGAGRPLRALPERLARRPARRVHDLGRRRVRQRAGARREDGPRDGADEGARQVPRAALLAGRPHRRVHPLERRLPDLAVAGDRDRRLPRGGRRDGRAGPGDEGRRRAAVRRVERAALRDADERQERGRPRVDPRLDEPRRRRGARGGPDREGHGVRGVAGREVARVRRRLPGVRHAPPADGQAARPRAEGGVDPGSADHGERGRVPALVRRQPRRPLLARRRAVHAAARRDVRVRARRTGRAAEAAGDRGEDRLHPEGRQARRPRSRSSARASSR